MDFSSSGDVRSYVIEKKEDSIPELILQSLFEQEGELFWTSGEGDLVYFIDGAYDLFSGSMPLDFMNMARFDW